MIGIKRGDNMNDFMKRLANIEDGEPLKDEVEAIDSSNMNDTIPSIEVKKQLKERDEVNKFILRLPKSIGNKIRKEAEAEGVSLNQFILMTTAYYLGHKD